MAHTQYIKYGLAQIHYFTEDGTRYYIPEYMSTNEDGKTNYMLAHDSEMVHTLYYICLGTGITIH